MNNEKHIIIIADAGPIIGTGHVMRCVALGTALIKKNCRVSIIGRINSEYLYNIIQQSGITGYYLDLDAKLDDILHIFFDLYYEQLEKIPWVIIDGYQFCSAFQEKIKKTDVKLLMIDDYAHLSEYKADIIINPSISHGDLKYNVNPETIFLFGPSYALLRDEFINRYFPPKVLLDRVDNLLITLGGADSNNATLKVLERLDTVLFSNTRIWCIIGPHNLNRESIEKYVESSLMDVKLLSSVTDMPSLMSGADFAISAAGSTCWELAHVGVPFVTLITAENQIHISSWLKRSGIAPTAGWADSFGFERLDQLLKTFSINAVDKKKASIEGRKAVDGLGAARIADLLVTDRN